ncbi:MAG: hypothetical protein ACREOH_12000, partial [Candidatus Entotheonellia bacterium]
MMPLDEMEQQRISFLYELYKRSEGDPCHGVPYEELVEALGVGEPLAKRIQRALQQEGLVELTALPRITNVGRTVIGHKQRGGSQHTIGITHPGVRIFETILSHLSYGGVH